MVLNSPSRWFLMVTGNVPLSAARPFSGRKLGLPRRKGGGAGLRGEEAVGAFGEPIL